MIAALAAAGIAGPMVFAVVALVHDRSRDAGPVSGEWWPRAIAGAPFHPWWGLFQWVLLAVWLSRTVILALRLLRVARREGSLMIMSPRLHRFALTAHVTSAVGWLGAVVVFLALAIVGVTSQDAQIVRGVYLVMEPAAWSVLIPLAFASPLTGIVQGLGTTWGLFRHYWVLFKLLITVFATIVLLMYMETFRLMARMAADPKADLSIVRNASPALHAVLALLVLLSATVLAVYKPRGLTPYGRRKQSERRQASQPMSLRRATAMQNREDVHIADVLSQLDSNNRTRVEPDRRSAAGTPRWAMIVLGIMALLLVLLFVVLHLAGGGHGGH
ncbi:MAG: hypothetical protein ACRD2X_20690 [Vicinamibacteraceae bacterium]